MLISSRVELSLHKKLKGPVPPVIVISILPVAAPLQSTFVIVLEMVIPVAGWLTIFVN